MSSSPPSLRAGSRAPSHPSRWLRAAMFGGLVVFAAILAWNLHAVAGGSDSSGYLNQARLLRAGIAHPQFPAQTSLLDDGLPQFTFIPYGFVINTAGAPSPTYPIGLPLLIVGTSACVGWEAGPPLTIALHALAGLGLMYALGRQSGLPAPWAAFGTLLLGASPLYLFSSFTLMSDVPALVWTTLAVLLAGKSERHAGWAAAAGFALSVAVLIRPTNLFAILPVAVALGIHWRSWLCLGLAGLPGALALGAYNFAAYGHPFLTGYRYMDESFGLAFIGTTLLHYARWLPVLLTPMVLLAPALWWVGRDRRTALLTGWIVAFGGFYLFYAFTHGTWWFLRFLLPAFPPLIVAALLVAQKILHAPRAAAALNQTARWSPLVVALALIWSLGWARRLHSFKSGRNDLYYPEAVTWAKEHLPANTLLLSAQLSGAIYCYSDFAFARWDHLEPFQLPALERTARREKRPVIAALFEWEEQNALRDRLPGQWEKVGGTPRVTFWRRVIPAVAPP